MLRTTSGQSQPIGAHHNHWRRRPQRARPDLLNYSKAQECALDERLCSAPHRRSRLKARPAYLAANQCSMLAEQTTATMRIVSGRLECAAPVPDLLGSMELALRRGPDEAGHSRLVCAASILFGRRRLQLRPLAVGVKATLAKLASLPLSLSRCLSLNNC